MLQAHHLPVLAVMVQGLAAIPAAEPEALQLSRQALLV
jgi:hypothetical protein